MQNMRRFNRMESIPEEDSFDSNLPLFSAARASSLGSFEKGETAGSDLDDEANRLDGGGGRGLLLKTTIPVNCLCGPHHMLKTSLASFLASRSRISFGFNFGHVKTASLYYNTAAKVMSPFIIGVCGGTASGKTTVCLKIMQMLDQLDIPQIESRVICITEDSFYRELSEEEKIVAESGEFDFDCPDALDVQLMTETIEGILAGKVVKIPIYDFKKNARKIGDFITVYPADVILFEGILVFHFKAILDALHMKIFVDTDSDVRLSRRIFRDVEERGRSFTHVLTQYIHTVKPSFEQYCQPTKRHADIILPGGHNRLGITMIVQHIKELLFAKQNGVNVSEKFQIDDVRFKNLSNGNGSVPAPCSGVAQESRS